MGYPLTTSMYKDAHIWRNDFPILSQVDKRVAFFDTAASAQKPKAVIDAMAAVMEGHYANIHRGLYDFSQKTTSLYEDARNKVAKFIKASNSNEVVFTRNTTEAINLVAQSWGRSQLKSGDEIVITEMEHHANIVPWVMLEEQLGVVLKVAPVLDDGRLDFDAFKALLSDKTRLVSFVHISNASGVKNDASGIVSHVRAYNENIKVLVDGSQSIVHTPINVGKLDADFFVFTGHKLYGPSGIGVLWGREEILNEMPPYQGGGDMIETVSFNTGVKYKNAPSRFEAGTPAIVEAIGLGAAVDYVDEIGVDNISNYENDLYQYMRQRLGEVEGLIYLGDVEDKAPVASFYAEWGHISDIATILDQCGVAVRSGHHCAMPLMERFSIEGTIRASIGLYNTREDVDMLIDGLKKAHKFLG